MIIIIILAHVIMCHDISPLWGSKVKNKRHLHSAWPQDSPVSQKPPSPIVQGHNLWRAGSIFRDRDFITV